MPRKSDSKPRGRMTAYAFFVQATRAEEKKNHPDESVVFAEFSRMCGQKWKTLSNEEKKRFGEMSERDKVRYDLEMEGCRQAGGSKKVERGKKKRLAKDVNAPKRSLSAFFWFCNDQRPKIKEKNPEFGVGEIANQLGKLWAELDPMTKQQYEAIAQADKLRYFGEMEAYKQVHAKVEAPANIDVDADDEDEDDDDE